MPRIDHIEHGTYNEKFDSYLAKHDYHEDPLHEMKNFLEKLKSGEINKKSISDIVGLDKESFQLNGGSPLNQLSLNLQKDINDFIDEMGSMFYEAFIKEIRTHREDEAIETYKKEKEWYEKKYLSNPGGSLQDAVNEYNHGHRKYDLDEETNEYKKRYMRADIKHTGTLQVYVAYERDGNISPKSDSRGIGLISKIIDEEQKAYNDYITYIEPAEKLKAQYEGTGEVAQSPSILESINEDLWGNDTSEKNTSSSKENGGKSGLDRPGYETVAILNNGKSGDYVLYRKKQNGIYYYYVEGKDGEMYLAKRNGVALTEADVMHHQGEIKVETGSKYGDEHFSFSKDEIKDISSVDKDTIAKLTSTNINRKGYEAVAKLDNGKSGEYVLYSKEIGDKKFYYIEGEDGEMYLAKRNGVALTEADVMHHQGKIKVETGSKYGDEHYYLNKDMTSISSDDNN